MEFIFNQHVGGKATIRLIEEDLPFTGIVKSASSEYMVLKPAGEELYIPYKHIVWFSFSKA